jgi:hypothetical protein
MRKTHTFTPKEVEEIKKIGAGMRKQGCYWRYISQKTGVSVTTLREWLDGRYEIRKDYRNVCYRLSVPGKIGVALRSSIRNAIAGGYTACIATRKELIKTWTGKCYICEVEHKPTRIESLHLDHCHTTGKFRGWLCGRCNHVLGHAKDRIEVLMKAVEYLRGHSV